MLPSYQSFRFTNFALKEVGDRRAQFDDLVKLHKFGMLSALSMPPSVMRSVQHEFDRAYPDNIPSEVQAGIYRLALMLIGNDPKSISTFTAPRAYYVPLDDPRTIETSVEWRAFAQCSNQGTDFNPDEFLPDPEPRPRLIDRMRTISDETARRHLRAIKSCLCTSQYDIIYQRCVKDASYAEIAERRHCKPETLVSSSRKAMRHLRWECLAPMRIVTNVFGPSTIGRIV